jgi:hypothetical protein
MLAQCANKRFDRFELGSHGSGTPFLQVPLGPIGTRVVPEELEALFEQVGADAFEVVLKDIGQFGSLTVGEVFLLLQEAEGMGVTSPYSTIDIGWVL